MTPASPPPADPSCPVCKGRMWDNRKDKTNPRAPDFKCRTASCKCVIWPNDKAKAAPAKSPADRELASMLGGDMNEWDSLAPDEG